MLAAALAGPILGALSAAAPDQPPEQFDLEVGKQTYAVTPEKPFSVMLPNGDTIAAVLHRRKSLRYVGHGVTFDYPVAMRASTEQVGIGVYMVTLDSADTPVAILHLIDGKVDPAHLLADEVQAQRSGMVGNKARVVPGSIAVAHKTIAGRDRTGTSRDVTLAGSRLRQEIYAFALGESTVAVVLQYSTDEKALAGRQFDVICASLKSGM